MSNRYRCNLANKLKNNKLALVFRLSMLAVAVYLVQTGIFNEGRTFLYTVLGLSRDAEFIILFFPTSVCIMHYSGYFLKILIKPLSIYITFVFAAVFIYLLFMLNTSFVITFSNFYWFVTQFVDRRFHVIMFACLAASYVTCVAINLIQKRQLTNSSDS